MVLQQLQETKGSVSKRKSPGANKINSPCFWRALGKGQGTLVRWEP